MKDHPDMNSGAYEAMMAQIEWDAAHAGSGDDEGPGFAWVFNFLGAISAIALILGLGFWGYQLAVRDVRGVPVVRALEGPSRVQPENPGGQLAENEGLAVNAVQSETADVVAPEIILATAPITLEEQDFIELSSPNEAVETAPGSTENVSVDEEVLPVVNDTNDAVAQAIALAIELDEDRASTGGADGPAFQIVPATISGVKISPRPNLRPKVNLAAFTRSGAPLVQPSTRDVDLDPSAIPSGARLVQVGAYDDRTVAIEEWNAMAARFADYMEDKNRVIQEAQSGGRKFYRLRIAGFDTLESSRRFCSVLTAAKAPCIPVAAR